jgi:hypothetical protein
LIAADNMKYRVFDLDHSEEDEDAEMEMEYEMTEETDDNMDFDR